MLASYAYGLGEPAFVAGMWGGVPEAMRPIYTVSMILAALGYFPMTAYMGWRFPARDSAAARFGYANACYASVLFASALWVPLTLALLDAPSTAAWLAVRLALIVAALGSLGILVALLWEPVEAGGWLCKLAIAGCVLFCNQTLVLDALVGPYFFPVGV